MAAEKPNFQVANESLGYLHGKTEGLEQSLNDMRDDFHNLRTELKQDLNEMNHSLKNDVRGIKSDFNDKIKKLDNRMWWVLGILVSSTVLVLLKEYIINAA